MTNRKDDRDATIDRLLAASPELVSPKLGLDGPSERGPVPPELVVGRPSGGGCLDADTLAAWADNALSAAELSAVEVHAADCARCQAMLAAMAKTAPAPTAAVAPWWMPSLRWLVPLTATAAAAILVWILVLPRGTNVRQVSQIAESSTPAQPPSLAEPPSPTAAAAADRERRAQSAPAENKEAELSRQSANVSRPSADVSPPTADLSRLSAEGAKAESAKADSARADQEADKKSEVPRDAPAAADSRLEKAKAANDLSRRSAEGAKAEQAAAPATAAPAAAPLPAAAGGRSASPWRPRRWRGERAWRPWKRILTGVRAAYITGSVRLNCRPRPYLVRPLR